jgi:hypothetical protein
MGLGRLPWPFLRNRHTSAWSNQSFIIAHAGLGVCDGAHSWFVMKKGSGVIAENAKRNYEEEFVELLRRYGISFDKAHVLG